ncbi:MAG: helix-turn-helix transcriptional regulator [Selenomonadaceae bacterium]|nr:helix-turn-helix transcriptional regulator [Selenomonadaceae bacterium]MBR4383021.1 helix-turn-helix transcriptional regulator [Selenomonadaceae bacterium]
MNITACRLRVLRQESKMSQQAVADFLGITRTAYNKYESGVIKPVRKLNELAALFGVTADYILGRDEKLDAEDVTNPHDHKQVKKYLSLSNGGKEIVDIMLDAIYDREKKSSENSNPSDTNLNK